MQLKYRLGGEWNWYKKCTRCIEIILLGLLSKYKVFLKWNGHVDSTWLIWIGKKNNQRWLSKNF